MTASPVTRHPGSINTAPNRLLLLLVILAANWSADALAVGAATQLLAAAQRGDEARVLQLKTGFDSKPKPARGDKKTARALNEEALKLLRSGDFPAAIDRLAAAAEADSGDAEVLGNLGYAYLMIHRFADAKATLERALELAPTRSATWGNLGEAYAGLGDEPAAIAALRLAYQFSRNREKTIAYFTLLIEKPDASPMLISAAKEAQAAPDLAAGARRGTVAEEARQLSESLSPPPVTRGIEAAQRNASEARVRSTGSADPIAGDREPTALLSNTQGHLSPASGMIKTTLPSSHDPVEARPQASPQREGRAAGHSSQRDDAGVGVAGLATTSSQWVTFALAACLLVALTYIATNHFVRRQLPAAGRTALPRGGDISPPEKATLPQAPAIVEESAPLSGSAMLRVIVSDSGTPHPIDQRDAIDPAPHIMAGEGAYRVGTPSQSSDGRRALKNEKFSERLERISQSNGYASLPFREKWRLIYTEAPIYHKAQMLMSVAVALAILVGWPIHKFGSNDTGSNATSDTISKLSPEIVFDGNVTNLIAAKCAWTNLGVLPYLGPHFLRCKFTNVMKTKRIDLTDFRYKTFDKNGVKKDESYLLFQADPGETAEVTYNIVRDHGVVKFVISRG